jgi:menaquinone-dependent protoporphyrinogen oxidase
MKRVLVTYASMAGSTAEVAAAVAEELEARGLQADVRPIDQVDSPAGYDGVVVGGPMIMGWHRGARRFLRRYRREWARIPLAVFVLAISLTETAEQPDGAAVTVDDRLPKPPARPGRLSLRERHTRLAGYLRPIFAAAGPAAPRSVGVFGGRLEYGRLKWWAVLFVMGIIKAPAGDRRNWPAIRAWAAELPAAMGFNEIG